MKKLSIKHAKIEAKKRGGKCISNEYVNIRTELKWKCKNNHTWFAKLNDIKNMGHWCPVCANNIPLGIVMASKVAEQRGGKCVSTKYKNNKIPLQWECKDGHTWFRSLGDIKNRGDWCPECNKNFTQSKKQRELTSILGNIFNCSNIETNYREFEWLTNTNTNAKLEIDIWLPEIKLAVEYDGSQHFEKKFNNSDKDLAEIKKRDKLKNLLIKNNSNEIQYFLRFNFKEKLNHNYVISKIINNFPKLKDKINERYI